MIEVRCLLGALILLSPFLAMFVFIARRDGIGTALMVYGLTALVVLVCVLAGWVAIWLMTPCL